MVVDLVVVGWGRAAATARRPWPRWLALVTYGLALVLLFGVGFTTWVTMILPAWVFLISVLILISDYRGRDDGTARRDGVTAEE